MNAALVGAVTAAALAALAALRHRSQLRQSFAVADRRLGAGATAAHVWLAGTGPVGTVLMVGFVAGGRADMLWAELGAVLGALVAALWVAPRARASAALTLPNAVGGAAGLRWGRFAAPTVVLLELGWAAVAIVVAQSLFGGAAASLPIVAIGVAVVAALAATFGGARGLALAALGAAAFYILGGALGLLAAWGRWREAGMLAEGWQAISLDPRGSALALAVVFAIREAVGGAQWQRYLSAADPAAARAGAAGSAAIRAATALATVGLGLVAVTALKAQRVALLGAWDALAERLGGFAGPWLQAAVGAVLLLHAATLLHTVATVLDVDVAGGRRRQELGWPRRLGLGAVAAAAAAAAALSYRHWEPVWIYAAELAMVALAALIAATFAHRTPRPAWLVVGGLGGGAATLVLRTYGLVPEDIPAAGVGVLAVILAAWLGGTRGDKE